MPIGIRFTRKVAVAGLVLAALASAVAADPPASGLAGRITTATTPLAQVRVYAYQMSDLSLRRVDTDNIGKFAFDSLPAGLYKIIAFKAGFVPAVVLLARDTAEMPQYLEVDLAPQSAVTASDDQSFWSLRQKIPKDVLRDVETLEMTAEQATPGAAERAGLMETRLEAFAGSDSSIPDSTGVSHGQVAMAGTLGESDFDVMGDYWLAPSKQSRSENSYAGELSVSLSNPNGSKVRVATTDNSLNSKHDRYDQVDLERYQVSWSQNLGRGTSLVKAEFVEEANFYTAGAVRLRGMPKSSRTWNVEGSYSGDLTANNKLNTGFRYRQYEGYHPSETSYLPSQRVDLFGLGSTRVKPRLMVQYGVFSTMRDGSLSLAPQGGVVVELGSAWRASTLASHQVHRDDPTSLYDFMPMAFSGSGTCQSEEYCYQVELSRSGANDGGLSIGAMHRRFGETMRLYFNEDFFSHLESIYLVEGDTLPELQFAVTRRISPQVMTRLQSNVAAGGGGVLYATKARAYENSVRYLVTSLDTRFENTDTGVYLAFHHLEQGLDPIVRRRRTDPLDLEMQRLQLVLTQDLRALNLESLAVRLNMEVARGATGGASSQFDQDELHKRVMGGIAVSF